ncbi:RND family efflux transporter, MFP subunit [Verrucomicrobium sp. GAS474]|uniref:efflux RND transporter periplasmic adaptor subunit n=1 Tax=Verrucomicrobium sp. GAS474 TaxID=1882831 RepID=UPI00087BEDC8|nr:efflux RND transporter periplasmic adaptor subunit [Verrucomicrobium sp. GAS474]SDT88304.1 RND family efflux transporter, MFP subunit [Verrucomicrobium sp. GAS474]
MNFLRSLTARIPYFRTLSIALLAVVAFFAYSYFSRPAAEVYRVHRGTAIAAVYGTVRIEWTSSVGVRAQNSGYIQLKDISPGQSSIGLHVRKDQVLATIVDEATAREISQTKIDLDAALAKQKVGPADAIALEASRTSLARTEKLNELTQLAPAQMEGARNDVKRLEDLVKGEQILLDQAVETNRQNLKNFQDKMARSLIKSPIDGVLTAIANSDNELVTEGNVVFTIAQPTTYVSGQVNEEDVGRITDKLKAKLRLYSFPDIELLASVTSVLPYPDPATQRYTVILSLDNPPPNLMAGMTGEMNVIIGKRENSLLIPTSAIRNGRVFVVGSGGTVSPRNVKFGFRSMETTEILEGIQEGERVIVADQDLFHPGDHVRALEINPDATGH